ncbi:MAG: hypothetical protein EOO16_10855 [Chitinophagaceae bacterium]|nr:MAG: hypothetical protein EOO16_10855 [Chitinophagaceae bacterium]
MTTKTRSFAGLLALGALACLLSFFVFNGVPAKAALAAPAVSDSTQAAPESRSLREVRDSLLRRYPFLRQVQVKDEKGRLCDIFGRPMGC